MAVVRGEGPVAGGSHDEVDVRRAVRVPSGGVQQRADRPVGGDRVIARHHRAEPEGAICVRGEQAAAVGPGLPAGLLDIVEALVTGLPDVELGAGKGGPVRRQDPAADEAAASGDHGHFTGEFTGFVSCDGTLAFAAGLDNFHVAAEQE